MLEFLLPLWKDGPTTPQHNFKPPNFRAAISTIDHLQALSFRNSRPIFQRLETAGDRGRTASCPTAPA